MIKFLAYLFNSNQFKKLIYLHQKKTYCLFQLEECIERKNLINHCEEVSVGMTQLTCKNLLQITFVSTSFNIVPGSKDKQLLLAHFCVAGTRQFIQRPRLFYALSGNELFSISIFIKKISAFNEGNVYYWYVYICKELCTKRLIA